jgi:hypothetical protein
MLFTGFHWGIVSKAYGASDVIQVTSQSADCTSCVCRPLCGLG